MSAEPTLDARLVARQRVRAQARRSLYSYARIVKRLRRLARAQEIALGMIDLGGEA